MMFWSCGELVGSTEDLAVRLELPQSFTLQNKFYFRSRVSLFMSIYFRLLLPIRSPILLIVYNQNTLRVASYFSRSTNCIFLPMGSASRASNRS